MTYLNRKLSRFGLATAMGLGLVTAAHATPLPQFTFAPSVLGGGAAGVANVVADDLTLSDYSTITFSPGATPGTSNFTETGTLDVVQLQLASASVNTPINTSYGMYFSFTATGTQTNYTTSLSSGSFNTLSFSLYGFAIPPSSGAITFNPDNSTPSGVVNPTLLATGSLQNGTVTLVNGVPSANAAVSFNVVDQPFFVAPVPFYDVALSAFTNTSSEVSTTNNVITITQGGGTANFFSVPEPASLILLGSGLVGIGIARRRRSAA